MAWTVRGVGVAAIALGVLMADALPVGGRALPPDEDARPDPPAEAVPGAVWSIQRGPALMAAEAAAPNLSVLAQPDITATPLGFVVGDGPYAWGHTARIDDPVLLKATRSGPGHDLCIIAPAGFRAFNRGPVPSGPFTTTVYRGDAVVHADRIALPPDSGTVFRRFDLPVHRGLNTITVVVDSDHEVNESDENNTFVVTLDVTLDCDGRGDNRSP